VSRRIVDADHTAAIRSRPVWLNGIQIYQSETVVFVVICHEGQRRILILDLGVEDRPIPFEHLLEVARAIDDMNEFRRGDKHRADSPSFAGRSSSAAPPTIGQPDQARALLISHIAPGRRTL
jgi:hypothetical protein